MRFNLSMTSAKDEVRIAVTNDGAFRILAAKTRATVQGVLDAQAPSSETASLLANLVTGTVLFRLLMAPTLRVQAILKGASGSGHIIADSHPEGWARGLVNAVDKGNSVTLGSDSILQMMRTLANGELQQGLVEASHERGIDGALMSYLQQSEQIVSVARVSCTIEDGMVQTAGGFVVQLLPEAPEGSLMVMTERLDHDFTDLDGFIREHGDDPSVLLGELAYGMEHTETQHQDIRFGCACSRLRVLAGLGTLSKEEVAELMSDKAPIELGCDYCGQLYHIRPEELRGLLSSS